METAGSIYHQHPPLPLGEGSGVREKMPQARKISILPKFSKTPVA